MIPKLAAYVSAFNVVQNGLPWKEPLHIMLRFFDEVVVAVNASTDDTANVIRGLATALGEADRLRVVDTAFSYTDVTFDGAIKNAALQACSKGPEWVYVQMDLDEEPIPSQHALWRDYAGQLLSMPGIECFMIPSLDLWGSLGTIRADKPVGTKFRMHKEGLRRGVWKAAWLSYGKRFRTDMSDSTELLTADGDIASSMQVVPSVCLQPTTVSMLSHYPFTVHKGYLDLGQRVRVNKAIWADHWTLRNGGEDAKVATTLRELTEGVPLIPHRLPLI